MAKKQKNKLQRPVTKRQLSRWQREQRWQRISLGIGIAVILLIIGIPAYGYYRNEVQPLHQPAIRVNDRVFNMDYYVKMLRLYVRGVEPAQAAMLLDLAIETIQHGELIRQNAREMGIDVDEKEVSEALKRNKLSQDKVFEDMVRAQLLLEKMRKEYFEPKVSARSEQVHLLAMLLESKRQAQEISARLKAGEDFGTLAREISFDLASKEKGGDLGWIPKEMGNILLRNEVMAEAAFKLQAGELSEPVYDEKAEKKIGYWLIKMVEKSAETLTVRLQVILLGSLEEAEEIRTKIEAGEDFDTLAQAHSQHILTKGKGGKMDWVPGEISETFDNAAARLRENELSEPIRDETVATSGGYWLLKVVEREAERELEEKHRSALIEKTITEWLEEQAKQSKIESYLDELEKSWALKRAQRR